MKKLEADPSKVKLNLPKLKRTVPDDLLLRAKQLYMGFKPVSEISRELGIKRTTLQYYCSHWWKKERDLISSEFIASITSSRAEELAAIQGSAIQALRRCLADIATRSVPPTTKEALDAAKILESMDKLAKASPDEYKSVSKEDYHLESQEEIREVEELDPFSSFNSKGKKDE